jgi:pilus assembly protein CpaB
MLFLSGVALVLSVFITVAVYRLLRHRLSGADEFVSVVVAAEKLPLGSRITEAQLRTVTWPKSAFLEGSFKTMNEIVGRGVITPIYPNEPILEAKLAPKEAGAGLTTVIPEGMRAVGVKVNDVIGVAGFVVPGTHVDVIVSGSTDDTNKAETSKVVLENIQVLAAGQNVEQTADGKPQNVQVVTLLVTPEDSEKLALASVDGKIHLSLRNPLDMKVEQPSAIDKVTLYRGSRPAPVTVIKKVAAKVEPAPVVVAPAPPPPPAPPQKIAVELIQGTNEKTLTFEVVPQVIPQQPIIQQQ